MQNKSPYVPNAGLDGRTDGQKENRIINRNTSSPS